MAGEKKTVVKPFRMTEKEADKLKSDAKQRGMKESEYIRLLMSQKPNDYPEIRILLRDLINEVNANRKQYQPDYKEPQFKAVPRGGQGTFVSLYEEAEFAGKRGGGFTWQSVRYFISVTVVPVMQESI